MDPLDILLSAFEREEDLRTPSPLPPSSPAAAPPSLSSSSSSSAAPQSTSSSSDTPPPTPTSSSPFSPAPPSVPSPSPHSTPPTSFSLPSPAASPHLLFTLDNSLNSDFEPLLASPGLTPFTTSTPPPAAPSLPQDLLTAHTITAAESQAKVKHVMDVLGREELQRKSRDEQKRRLAIRRRLDEQKKREKIQEYWSNLHSSSLEETQPFIKGFLIVALLVVVAVLVAEYAYTLDWSGLFG